MKFLQKIFRPEVYHGRRRGPFFEGWFYRVTDKDGRALLAFIPGIHLHRDPAESHAFIQVVDGSGLKAWYVRYPLNAFSTTGSPFSVSIGESEFTLQGMRLKISDKQLEVEGEVTFGSLDVPQPRMTVPSIMGWYAYVPRMECNHGLLSHQHTLEGVLECNGSSIMFDGGRGYIEKDWGSSFPEGYVWLQCNHFTEPGRSLMVSVAKIPWLGSSFRGFFLTFMDGGKEIRLATYTGAKISDIEITDERVLLAIEDKRYRFEVSAVRAPGVTLTGPYNEAMNTRVGETLQSKVKLRLSQKEQGDWKEAVIDTGRFGGLDVNGNLEAILQ